MLDKRKFANFRDKGYISVVYFYSAVSVLLFIPRAQSVCVNAATCGRSLINGHGHVGQIRSLQLEHLTFLHFFSPLYAAK